MAPKVVGEHPLHGLVWGFSTKANGTKEEPQRGFLILKKSAFPALGRLAQGPASHPSWERNSPQGTPCSPKPSGRGALSAPRKRELGNLALNSAASKMPQSPQSHPIQDTHSS